MGAKLVVSMKLRRERFVFEDYVQTDDDILAIISEGKFTFTVGGVTHTVKAGEGAIFRKGVHYRRKVVEPVIIYLFRYKSDSDLFSSDKVTFLDTERIFSTLRLIDRLEGGVFKDDFEYRARIFADVVTQYEIERGVRAAAVRDSVDAAITHLATHIHHKIYLPDVSRDVGLSYTQFSRRFRQKTGMTPSDYISSLRLIKAKKLLSDSELRIREIAAVCGFDNEYYFSNFFKKMTGTSPKSYRDVALVGK